MKNVDKKDAEKAYKCVKKGPQSDWGLDKVCKKCAQTKIMEGVHILLQLFNIGFVTEEDTRRVLMANALRDGLHRECAAALIDQIIQEYKS